jgi:hypothetical protein
MLADVARDKLCTELTVIFISELCGAQGIPRQSRKLGEGGKK